MTEYAIIAIGYNRPKCIKRLLEQIEAADYGNDVVDLIISIDNSGNNDVETVAKDTVWSHGNKIIKTYPERQGLRKHILQCGKYLDDYRAVAVFEDDIVPSRAFYTFMKAAVTFYENDDKIAGISLYNHLWNVNVSLPFQAAYTGYDAYFMQFPQSWGQIWMKRQWKEFTKWYEDNNTEFSDDITLPDFVNRWGNKSWLKYHVKFCVEKNKFFVYPYQALSTCYSDVGEHCVEKDTKLQVPMLSASVKTNWFFPNFGDKDAAYYDVFFERLVEDVKCGGRIYKKVAFDLYNSKRKYDGYRYLVSMEALPYRVVSSFALEQRPHDVNVIYGIPGNEIKLYDLDEPSHPGSAVDEVLVFRYRFRLYRQRRMTAKSFIRDLKNKIFRIS